MNHGGRTTLESRQLTSLEVGQAQASTLRSLVQTFVRTIGFLAEDRTPCGEPMPVSQAHALMVLLERRRGGQSPTQQDLGRLLGIDKSNVARLCKKMERAGHLAQKRSPDDGRARLLALTDRGSRVAATVERASRARFERLIAAIPRRARSNVLAALAVLNDAVAQSTGNAVSPSPRAVAQSARLVPPLAATTRRGGTS